MLPLEDVFRLRVDLWGVLDELPLVELFGEVVFEAILKAYGIVVDFLRGKNHILY